MKKAILLLLALVMCLFLCACAGGSAGTPTTILTEHTHDWKAANCTNPKTCLTCGETEGNAAGHDWKAANCTNPKTCLTCGETEGNAAGHDWNAANCTNPKICKTCGTSEGSANGHEWTDATCSAPKTCSVCKITEGSIVAHNYIDGACSMCGSKDPKVEQASNAQAANATLLVAEAYCDLFSEMIGDAWYFSIYKGDDYYDGDKAISAFSSYVGIEKSLVQAGVDSYLNKIGYQISSVARAAVLSTNSGALYVVDYALTNNDGFKNARECIDSAQQYIQKLDPSYASVNAYSDLAGYYSAVCAYFEFCYSPSGSYSRLSSTLSGFRTNCATYRNRCDIYL